MLSAEILTQHAVLISPQQSSLHKSQFYVFQSAAAVWSGPSLSANRITGYYRMESKGMDNALQIRRVIWICACLFVCVEV